MWIAKLKFNEKGTLIGSKAVKSDNEILVVAAVIDWSKHFVISTIWEAENHHRKIYNYEKHNKEYG